MFKNIVVAVCLFSLIGCAGKNTPNDIDMDKYKPCQAIAADPSNGLLYLVNTRNGHKTFRIFDPQTEVITEPLTTFENRCEIPLSLNNKQRISIWSTVDEKIVEDIKKLQNDPSWSADSLWDTVSYKEETEKAFVSSDFLLLEAYRRAKHSISDVVDRVILYRDKEYLAQAIQNNALGIIPEISKRNAERQAHKSAKLLQEPTSDFLELELIESDTGHYDYVWAKELIKQGENARAFNFLLSKFEKRNGESGYLEENRKKTDWHLAYHQIAKMYEIGIGTNIDINKALEFYSLAAGYVGPSDQRNDEGKYEYSFSLSDAAAIKACFLASDLNIFHKQYSFCRPFSFSGLKGLQGALKAKAMYDAALADPDPTIRLIRAVSVGKYDIAKQAVDDGANINQAMPVNLVRKSPHIGIKYTTAFWEALSTKNIRLVQLLVSNHVDVNWIPLEYRNKPYSVLGNLAGETYIGGKTYPHWDIAELLLNNGYKVRTHDIDSVSNLVRVNSGAKKKQWSDRLKQIR